MFDYIASFLLALTVLVANKAGGNPSSGVSAPPNVPSICGLFGAEGRPPTSQRINMHFFEPQEIDTVPYQVLIGSQTAGGEEWNWICTGILINEQWLITAAHCNVDKTVHKLRLRAKDLENPLTTPGKEPLDFDIEEIIQHPDYQTNKFTSNMALIKMATPVNLEENQYDIVPYCLAWGEDGTKNFIGMTTYSAGRSIEGGSVAPLNRKTLLRVLPAQACNEILDSEPGNMGEISRDDGICLEGLKADTGYCKLMTGSGASFINEQKRVVLIAMITAEIDSCPMIGQPMYAKKNLEWIKSTAF